MSVRVGVRVSALGGLSICAGINIPLSPQRQPRVAAETKYPRSTVDGEANAACGHARGHVMVTLEVVPGAPQVALGVGFGSGMWML